MENAGIAEIEHSIIVVAESGSLMPSHSKLRRPWIESLEGRALLAIDLAINAATRYQTIDGFGTALSGWKPALYSDPAFANMYYQDLGVSALRVALDIGALAGTDGKLETPVTLTDNLDANIALFDFNASNIHTQGLVAQQSVTKKLDSFKVIASIWTPPHWMKGEEISPATGKPTGTMPKMNYTSFSEPNSSGGSLIDTEENRTQFARYVAAYVKGFERAFGVPIDAVSLQNELVFHEPYHSCVYNPALYVKTIKTVAQVFSQMGITTKLIGPEDVGVGSTSDPYKLRRQFTYIDAIRADPVANAAIYGYAIHGYASDGVSANRSPEMWGQYWNGRTVYPTWTGISNDKKPTWMTEISGEAPTLDGAIGLALSAQDALTQANSNGWMYWQIQNSATVADAGSLTAGNSTTLPKYAAAKHFFRYIRPGAQRVSMTPSDPYGIYGSAFVSDSQKTLTSVLINSTATPQELHLSIGGGISVSSFDIAKITDATRTFANLTGLTIVNGIATFTIPARSIVTLQGSTAVNLGTDVALKKPATASTTSGGFVAKLANDGSSTTRWSSLYADNQWLQVDLGTFHNISAVNLKWEYASAKSYSIQTSLDGTTWTSIYSTTAGKGGTEMINGLSGTARYVRLALATRATKYGFSLFDFNVYGTKTATNIALGRSATSSSVAGGLLPNNATDGNMSTRWSSAFTNDEWLQIDLGSNRQITGVTLNWQATYGTGYKIQTSLNGTSWNTVFTTTTGDGRTDEVNFATTTARYVRFVGTARATVYGYSLYEMQVIGM